MILDVNGARIELARGSYKRQNNRIIVPALGKTFQIEKANFSRPTLHTSAPSIHEMIPAHHAMARDYAHEAINAHNDGNKEAAKKLAERSLEHNDAHVGLTGHHAIEKDTRNHLRMIAGHKEPGMVSKFISARLKK